MTDEAPADEWPSDGDSPAVPATTCARAHVRNREPVAPAAALEGVNALDVATWNYDHQDASIRHVGPLAEEFHDEFGVGADCVRIAAIDAHGVGFAAIQGLSDAVDDQGTRIGTVETTLEAHQEVIDHQQREIAALEADVSALSERVERLTDRIEALSGGHDSTDRPGDDAETTTNRRHP